MSVVEGRDAESLARAARVLSVRLIYIYETLAGVYCGRRRRGDKALCYEEVTRGSLYYPRWVICN
jgi:hypothetical protein